MRFMKCNLIKSWIVFVGWLLGNITRKSLMVNGVVPKVIYNHPYIFVYLFIITIMVIISINNLRFFLSRNDFLLVF